MSTDTGPGLSGMLGSGGGTVLTPRRLALLSTGMLVFAFTAALYGIVDVVGNPDTFLLIVAVSLVVATGLSRVLSVRLALILGLVGLVFGFWSYASALGVDVFANVDPIVDDVVSLLTGLSVLRLQRIELWVLGVTPAPVFLTWYLAMSRRYVASVVFGGLTLSFFVLTGDVGTTIALFGVLGAAGTVGFGRLDRFGGDHDTTDVLAVVLAAMVVLTVTVSVVPGGTGTPFSLLGAGGQQTIEGSLMSADQRLTIQGAIRLSPEVRFTVESERRAYWRAGAYNRYTGTGWVRSGSPQTYPGQLPGPPGETETIEQRYVIESRINTMPAAWRPVEVTDTENALVTNLGSLQPAEPFTAGDSYRVTSRRPDASPTDLRRAGDDYPNDLEDRYTQLPASTPDRVGDRTERITANADTAYDTAAQIEQWLESNREYSLDVERPDGNIADSFLFEMDSGYCTYYATTMVTMLRTQGIPARFVVGYTPGEQTGDDEYTVRGLDSHAWVEVYFPGSGWVKFDPTPAGPRADAEQERLEEAGVAGGDADLDLGDRETDTPTTPTTPTPSTPTTSRPTDGGDGATPPPVDGGQTATAAPTTAPRDGGGDGGLPLPDLPSREETVLGLVVLGGLAAGVRRAGLAERGYRAIWLRWQPRSTPVADVERAVDRVEHVLAEAYRPRRPGETPRQYVEAIDADERVRALYDRYERARYGGEATESLADEAVDLADDVVGDRTRLGGH